MARGLADGLGGRQCEPVVRVSFTCAKCGAGHAAEVDASGVARLPASITTRATKRPAHATLEQLYASGVAAAWFFCCVGCVAP